MISRRHFVTALSLTPLAAGLLDLQALADIPLSLPTRGLCAHRGCNDTFPENTLPAFRQALRLGAHMIEFDVQETRDGSLVIMHDPDVSRTTDGKGKISSLTLAEIRQLDAGIRKGPQFAGTPVPTFEEVLDLMPKNVWLNCDMKSKSPSVAQKSAQLILQKRRQQQAFLACYTPAMRDAALSVSPDILICNMQRKPTTREYVAETIKMNARFLQLTTKIPDQMEFTSEDLLPLRQNHIRANYFAAKTPAELKPLFERGIDFVLVNNLKDFLPAAHDLGISPLIPQY